MDNIKSRVDEIEELFAQNDTDGNGEIDFAEFSSLMRDLDEGILEQSLVIGFRDIDVDKDDRINLAEFLEWWSED